MRRAAGGILFFHQADGAAYTMHLPQGDGTEVPGVRADSHVHVSGKAEVCRCIKGEPADVLHDAPAAGSTGHKDSCRPQVAWRQKQGVQRRCVGAAGHNCCVCDNT